MFKIIETKPEFDAKPRINVVTNQSLYYQVKKIDVYKISIAPWVPLRDEHGKLIF